MADITPASPTLQGIPPELRNKIYNLLLEPLEPREVSGCKLLKLREQSPGGHLWHQFQSAIALHPLTATCRQMRAKFGSVLATTAGQTYHFNVNNLDPHQLTLYRDIIEAYCSSHRVSNRNIPPLLVREIVLCLELDNDILSSIEAYGRAARVQPRSGYGGITRASSEGMKLMLKPGSSVYDDSTGKSTYVTKAQAKLASDALRDIHKAYQLYEPDQRAIRILLGHLTGIAGNHS